MDANEFRYDVVEALDITRTRLQQDPNPTKEDLELIVTAVKNTGLANVKDETDRLLGIIDSDNFDSETVKSDVLKLLDSAIANQAAIGAGRRRRGKKTRKPKKKARRMTRRRGGLWPFTNPEKPMTAEELEAKNAKEAAERLNKNLNNPSTQTTYTDPKALRTSMQRTLTGTGRRSTKSRRHTRKH